MSNNNNTPFSGIVPGDVERLEIINVKKFIMSRNVELHEMFDTLKHNDKQERMFQKLPFRMRRRAMSYNPFRVPKTIRSHIIKEISKNIPKALKRLRKDKKRKMNIKDVYQRRSNNNRWLETHIYHAKRFVMSNLWGYKLALTSSQKSKRTIIRHSKRNCLIHDKSYMNIISVSGSLDSLRYAFKSIIGEPNIIFDKPYTTGKYKGGCVFTYRNDGTNYKLIAPINFIWIPSQGNIRCIWLIIHPGAKDELYNVLNKYNNISISLIENITIFELYGPLSCLYLKSVLKIDRNASKGNFIWNSIDPEKPNIPPSFILPILIKSPNIIGCFPPDCTISMMKKSYQKNSNEFVDVDLDNERMQLLKFDYTDSNHHTFFVPRRRKKNYTKLLEKLLHSINIRSDTCIEKSYTSEIDHTESKDKSDYSITKHKLVPVWIVNRNNPINGFEIILPSNTIANKLWILLNRYGCIGIGLNDRDFILNYYNLPSFPQDFPDTNTGRLYYSEIKRSEIQKYLLRPISRRINYSLIGIENPYDISCYDKSFDLNFRTQLNITNIKNQLYNMDILNSSYLMSGVISTGIHNTKVRHDFTLLRLTMPISSTNSYILSLISHLKNNNISSFISTIPINYYISARIKPFIDGKLSFLSRIYLPTYDDLNNFPQNDLTHSKIYNSIKYIPKLQEPLHKEYKTTNIKRRLYGNLKKSSIYKHLLIENIKTISMIDIKTIRDCIGFVTSKEQNKSGYCCITLRGLLRLIDEGIPQINDIDFSKIKLIAWIRNTTSRVYFPVLLLMSDNLYIAISYDEYSMTSYCHSDVYSDHVERPERITSIIKRLRNSKLSLKNKKTPLWDSIYYVPCRNITREILLLCHTEDYINKISYWTDKITKSFDSNYNKLKSSKKNIPIAVYPLDDDTYMTYWTENVARLAVGGIISLCDLIMDDKSNITKGFALIRPPGHHATSEKMMGFCIYNNMAIATKYLMSKYDIKRVAIIDWDVHQGNGTQEIFYNDRNVCFISCHRYGEGHDSFYPYMGNINRNDINNNKYNIPLEVGFDNYDLIYVFENVILPILTDFKPEFILISAGFDAAIGDLLGGCNVDPDGYSYIIYRLCQIAHKHACDRILLSLEGGYELDMLSKCVEHIIKTIVIFELINNRIINTCELIHDDDCYKFLHHYGFINNDHDSTPEINIYKNKFCDSIDNSKYAYIKSDNVKKSTISTCHEILNLIDSDLSKEFNLLSLNTIKSNIPIVWKQYETKISENTFIIAGAHQKRWLLPIDTECNEIIKLCSIQEAEFYEWLYNCNNLPVKLVTNEITNFKIDFDDDFKDVILTGICLKDENSEHNKNNSIIDKNVINYESNTNDSLVLNIIRFIAECSAIYKGDVFNKWKLDSDFNSAIRIKNLIHSMNCPCVMDLEMSTRLYDEYMDNKVKHVDDMTGYEIHKRNGFNISGIFSWNRTKQEVKYIEYQSLISATTENKITEIFKMYLMSVKDKSVISQIVEKFICRLNELMKIFRKQTSLSFIGTSLLFVLDSICDDVVSSANIYMIGLSHVTHNGNGIDNAYLLALKSIIHLLKVTEYKILNNYRDK